MANLPLDGLNILLMEDEALIAMDVEMLCRECGASEVTVARNANHMETLSLSDFHAAIVDLMLGGTPTTQFARRLREEGVPFVFATGYTDKELIFREFPDVPVIGKPYLGNDLVEALADVARQRS